LRENQEYIMELCRLILDKLDGK